MRSGKRLLLIFAFLTVYLLLEGFVMWAKPPQMSEAWFSDIAYNLDKEFNGSMARDIPWGASWMSGIGKLFFLVHHFVYKILGVGVVQARIVSFLAAYLLLFLLFRWAARNISSEVALFSTAILLASPSLWIFSSYARQDVMHSLFAFAVFYLLSTGLGSGRSINFFTAGFLGALSVEVDYRGCEIVLTALIFVIPFLRREAFVKPLLLFLAGSFVAFLIWLRLDVVPMGLSNFIGYTVKAAAQDGGPYNLRTVLSEFIRLIRYSDLGANLAKIEILYAIFLLAAFYRYRAHYTVSSRFILRWMLATFVVMTFVERTSYPSHFLKYSPFLFLLCGMGLRELVVHERKLGRCIFIFILLFGLTGRGARAGSYFYHLYIKKDYAPQRFFETLRSSVDMNKGIIGHVSNWYAFKDARYYGGALYLSRVKRILGDLLPPEEYKSRQERAQALLDVFRQRGIEYVIANSQFKSALGGYFPNGVLPEKNFELVAAIDDYFLGGEAYVTHPMKTEIYHIISYEY